MLTSKDNPTRVAPDAKSQRSLPGRHTAALAQNFFVLAGDATSISKQRPKLAAVSIARRVLDEDEARFYVHLAERGNDFSTKLDGFPLH